MALYWAVSLFALLNIGSALISRAQFTEKPIKLDIRD
jgi:hypothetical protein